VVYSKRNEPYITLQTVLFAFRIPSVWLGADFSQHVIYDSITLFQLLDKYTSVQNPSYAFGYTGIISVESSLNKLEEHGLTACIPNRNHWSMKRSK